MQHDVFFKINKPDIAFEVFDEDSVVVDLANGNYYNLNKSGSEICGGKVCNKS